MDSESHPFFVHPGFVSKPLPLCAPPTHTCSQNLLADNVWQWLEQQHPEVLAGVNPNNDVIDKLTGIKEPWL